MYSASEKACRIYFAEFCFEVSNMLSRIQDWDNRMLDRISKLRTKRLNKIMVGATTIGNSGLVWFVLAIALLPFQKYRTSGIAIIIAIIVSWLCGEVTIKILLAEFVLVIRSAKTNF